MPDDRFSNVAYVILGFLGKEDAEPLSGYDIKQWVDSSVRFFFAASYGQIYPELKKLQRSGLIEGHKESTGERARTEYEITDAGRELLREWLLQDGARLEMRDEGLLRTFFAGTLTREEQITKLRAMRDERSAQLAELHDVAEYSHGLIPDMPQLVLDYGLGLHEHMISWCDRAIRELEGRKD